ncbi:hypothetical protein K1T71_014488 [Dendrolimus kikuchii]|uniref:Uncharacterized protein n=1 Tax=Dendrolimus kikuchii TaxID=765133 RepID=A0ACC1CEJ5_9NEOP|nr:hypothetical protein K1T71_014488 [Dendrolimus kikuchii]
MTWRQLSHEDKIYTYEYFFQRNICRICWQGNANIEIPLETYKNEDKSSLIFKIKECLDIDFNYKNNLNKICDGCCKEIENFFDFKNFCSISEIKLREIFEKQSQNTENSASDIKNEHTDFKIDSIESYFEIQLEEYEKEPKAKKVKIKKKLKNKKHGNACFDCSICHINFENKNEIVKHNSVLHGVEEDGTIFKCFGCEKRFKSRRRRLGHETNFCKSLKDGYKCSICERFLPKRRVYESHMRNHRNNANIELPEYIFKCKKCLTTFKSKSSLKEHLLMHESEKHFVCDSCGRVFSRQDYLQKHILTHTGEKRHKCPHCDFRATQKSSLTVHIRKHTGERPYSCDLCPQQCTSSSNLLAHRRRHLGLKKYECKICKKKFGYKLSLDEHISSTHEQSQSYTCDICGASYTRIRGLRRHQLTKHGKEGKMGNVANNVKVDKVDELPKITEADDDGKTEKEVIIVNTQMKNEQIGVIELKDVLLVKNQDGDVYLV